jgi:glycolate oxidase FAD binding subunit
MQQQLSALIERVREAHAQRTPLEIRGGGSKRSLGEKVDGAALEVTGYRGVIEYEPTELVLSVRAGTPLREVEAALDQGGQMLPFEPPHYGEAATIGGCVATGLSGPRRAYAGSVRDFVLGVRVIDGQGKDLHFGGKVIKNVAGYDVSRLMVGAYGTLGVITEISFKVLPKPGLEQTLAFDLDAAAAIDTINRWAAKPLPLSASLHDGARLYVRLSGAQSAVAAASKQLGGTLIEDAAPLWRSLREHSHGVFASTQPLWRLSVPSTTPPLVLAGLQLIEWGGALRWLVSDADPAAIRAAVEKAGGSAMLFRNGTAGTPAFHPLQPEIAQLHERLKLAFDPGRILNPGRMYRGL